MYTRHLLLTALLILALLAPGASQALAQPAASPTTATLSTPGGPMLVVENAGQWPAAARFQVWNSPLGPGTTWLAEDAIWLVVAGGRSQVAGGKLQVAGSETSADTLADLPPANLPPATFHALRLTFPGSNPDARIEPFLPLRTTVSYFIGSDPGQWRPTVPVWGGVRYVDLYPGVDLIVGGQEGAWRFEAGPDTAVEQIRVQVEGADVVALDGASLRLAVAGKPLHVALPEAFFPYQVAGSSTQGQPLALTVGPGPYPAQRAPLIDNPDDLLYSTFLGGSGPFADTGSAIAVDGAGSAYLTGETGSTDFPTTPGAFDPGFNGGLYDAFVAKLNPAGSALVYATFLGGSGFFESGSGIAVDGTGNAYVVGSTESTDFPTTPGAFDPSFNGANDAFVAKLSPDGSALLYATYLGGGSDDYGHAIAVDGVLNAYVTGDTFSSDFPATSGAFDPSFNGALDAYVTKLNPTGSGLGYSTLLGGSGVDEGRGIAVNTAGNAFVAGRTSSSDFPTTPGAFDPTFNGGPFGAGDAFVAQLDLAGGALAYATFLGGSGGNDGCVGIAVGGTGNAYVAGQTNSNDFPTTPGAFDPTFNGTLDAFVASLNQAGSDLVYATYLGGAGLDGSAEIAADGSGSAYVSGSTNSSDFPTTPDAFDASHNGGDDVFAVKLNAAGSDLNYGTYLGGSGSDGGAIAVDGLGKAYLAGSTTSSDFPTTPGASDVSHNDGDGDAFVAKLNLTEPTAVRLIAMGATADDAHAGSEAVPMAALLALLLAASLILARRTTRTGNKS